MRKMSCTKNLVYNQVESLYLKAYILVKNGFERRPYVKNLIIILSTHILLFKANYRWPNGVPVLMTMDFKTL